MLADTRKQMLQLEKAMQQNQAMRLKYPTEPQRFIASEADLHEELRGLVVLTTNCALLYPEFVRLGGASALIELLSHENADIASAVIQVLEELTDDDVLDSDAQPGEDTQRPGLEAMHGLVKALREGQILALLVSNLSRFNDKPPASDDAAALENYDSDVQGVYHTLSVLENVVSLEPDAAEELVSSTSLLTWLLDRMQYAVRFDQNTAYSGELLAILLQDSEANRAALGEKGGIDALLKILAPYRKRDPADEEETEFMENVFDALCSCLLLDANKKRFLNDEGVELMVIMLKEKKQSRMRALKVLDHALSGAYGGPQCVRFVEVLGLKSLFAIFMLPTEHGAKGRAHATTAQDMEHVLGLIASLLHNLASDSAERVRVLSKFVEQDFSKIDRLLELRETMAARVQHAERTLAEDVKMYKEQGLEDDEIAELGYLRRLESGLYSLQLIDYLLAWLLMEDDGVRNETDPGPIAYPHAARARQCAAVGPCRLLGRVPRQCGRCHGRCGLGRRRDAHARHPRSLACVCTRSIATVELHGCWVAMGARAMHWHPMAHACHAPARARRSVCRAPRY